jgi:sortase A
MTQTLRGKWLMSLVLPWSAIGSWQVGEGLWIYAKAGLAQIPLERAWRRAVAGGQTPKAWPWADTWPVARLKNERLDVDLLVLAEAGGHALAFGPAHATGTALPTTRGTTVITGHRDTHFAFLRKLKRDDVLSVDMPDGRAARYVVRDTAVIDSRTGVIASDNIPRLALVTCYSFRTLVPGGPWRFVVMAEQQDANR